MAAIGETAPGPLNFFVEEGSGQHSVRQCNASIPFRRKTEIRQPCRVQAASNLICVKVKRRLPNGAMLIETLPLLVFANCRF